ncbi:hypothetical protein Sjap_024035 [Stephania japonica]|uniref:Uncharacterized protein n=1 Tax=Stephania japonica TaxID=461633 RepID=A0AAP0EI04_9MAGN
MRYEKQQFFDLSLLSPIPPPQAPGPSLPDPSDNSSSVNIVELLVPTVVGIPILLLAFFAYLRWRRIKRGKSIPAAGINGDSIAPEESLQFALDTIRKATNDFADANKLGRDGFGVVYKVKIKKLIIHHKSTNHSIFN